MRKDFIKIILKFKKFIYKDKYFNYNFIIFKIIKFLKSKKYFVKNNNFNKFYYLLINK